MKPSFFNPSKQRNRKSLIVSAIVSFFCLLCICSTHADEGDDEISWNLLYLDFLNEFYPVEPLGVEQDSDLDGVSDAMELLLGLDPLDGEDSTSDADNDLLTLAQELYLGTDPASEDTDQDSVLDGIEVHLEMTNPLLAAILNEELEFANDDQQLADGNAAAQQQAAPAQNAAPTVPFKGLVGGSFSGHNLERGRDNKIKWGMVEMDEVATKGGWTSANGKPTFEVQRVGGEDGNSYAELNGHDKSYGLQQKIELAPGTYILTWSHAQRKHWRAKNSAYGVTVQSGTEEAGDLLTLEEYEKEWVPHTGTAVLESDWSRAVISFTVADTKGDGSKTEVTITFTPTHEKITYGAYIDDVALLPMENAPDILRVNTDFDEGVLDSSGHGVPDAEDPDLKADRDSYHDLGIKKNDVVTEDLYRGWFGVRPTILPDKLANGATITIDRLEEIDPDTNQPETGEIRLHVTKGNGSITDHWPVEIENEQGQPVNLTGLLYGSSATIPKDGVTYWIEGVKPGKITLEFKLVKGDLEIVHQQKFEVCTEQSKAEWQTQVKEEILLDSAGAIDIDTYQVVPHPLVSPLQTVNFRSNIENIKAVYDHYAKIYCLDEETYYWAGLAKLAGAPVYAGLSDAQYGRVGTQGKAFPLPMLGNKLFRDIQDILIEANINIFNDLAWQFAAYRSSGICALEYVSDQNAGALDFIAWEIVNEGVLSSDSRKILDGNKRLLRREQEEILRQTYIDLNSLGNGAVGWLFTVMAENPVPGGPDFADVVPGGNLTKFADRWVWITDPSKGMWILWTSSPKPVRKTWVEIDLRTRADDYKSVLLLPVW